MLYSFYYISGVVNNFFRKPIHLNENVFSVNSSETILYLLGLTKSRFSPEIWGSVCPCNWDNNFHLCLKKTPSIKKYQLVQFTLRKEYILSYFVCSQVSLLNPFLILLFIILNIDYFYILTLLHTYTKKFDFYLIKQLKNLEHLCNITKNFISKLLIFITITIKYVLKLIVNLIFFPVKYLFGRTVYFLYACLNICFFLNLFFMFWEMIPLLEINFNNFLDFFNIFEKVFILNTETLANSEIQSLGELEAEVKGLNLFMLCIQDLNVYFNNNNLFYNTEKSWTDYLFDSQFEGFTQGNLESSADNFYFCSDNFEKNIFKEPNNINLEANISETEGKTSSVKKRVHNEFELVTNPNKFWPEDKLEWAIFIFLYSSFLCGYFYLWGSVTGFF